MAITTSIVLPSPAEAYSGIPIPLGVEVRNSEASAITITGIQLYDRNGVLVVGDFSQALPAKFQIISGGTAVTSSVPNWGAGDQSTKTISNSPLVYWVGNVSGSSLQTITTSGSFGGNNINFTPVSASVVIPAGATGSFQVAALTQVGFEAQPQLGTFVADLQAKVSVSGSAKTYDSSGANNVDCYNKIVRNVVCSLVGYPLIIDQSAFTRSLAFSNFDAQVNTSVYFTDNTQLVIPSSWPINDYTSSDPAVVSVVQNGAYSATTGSQYSSSSGYQVNPYQTQLIAGAGAVTFTGFPSNFDPVTINSAVISNRLAPNLTGSVTIGLREFSVVDFYIQPNLVSIMSGTLATPSRMSTIDLDAVYVLSNGQVRTADEIGFQPTWASSNSTILPINVSGTITASVNTQANVLITATNPNTGLPTKATCNVVLNLNPNA